MAHRTLRERWYQNLNAPEDFTAFALLLNWFLAGIILLNLIDVVWSSMPEGGWDQYAWIPAMHVLFTLVFAAEWSARFWVAAEEADAMQSPWRCRWRYLFSPLGMIDFLSFMPVLIWLVIAGGNAGEDFRILKLVAIVRMFKLTRYSTSLSMLAHVYRENYRILLAAVGVLLLVSFISATGIYLFERYAQPEHFGSIPHSLWWAFVTLTTVGYGDVVPITIGGKLFGGLVMLCGIGLAATPAGIFASTFVQLIREQERERRRRGRAGRSKEENHSTSAQVELSSSEKNDVNVLMKDFDLTLDQAIGVVLHFRR